VWLVSYFLIYTFFRHSPSLNFGFLFPLQNVLLPTFLQSHQPSFFLFILKTSCSGVPPCRIHLEAQQISQSHPFTCFCTLNSKTAYHTSFLHHIPLFHPLNRIHVPMSQSVVPTNRKSIFHPITFLVLGVNQQLICSVVITVYIYPLIQNSFRFTANIIDLCHQQCFPF
jgi:hypothetical protein